MGKPPPHTHTPPPPHPPRARTQSFWLFQPNPPPPLPSPHPPPLLLNQQTHFVLFRCFAITTRECNSSLCSKKKVYISTKRLAHSRRHELFFFRITFLLSVAFFFLSIDPHKYNICLFPCSPQKEEYRHRYLQTEWGRNELSGSSMSHKIIIIKTKNKTKKNVMKSL